MSVYDFGAYVVAALLSRAGAAFALSDGTVRFEGGEVVHAHEDGAILCAALHPSGSGVVTGGDDGRLMWSQPTGATVLADAGARWIDAVATSPVSGLSAFAAGRERHVRDGADPGFARSFRHDRSLADLAFDPKGRRIAAATYGGAVLWYARIADQKPQMLRWAGSHIGVLWSPDGRFLLSAMQENALHGWRLSDAKDMRMGGYPSKVKSMAFLAEGRMMATSGAAGAVVWPFAGANGPMGKEAVEVAAELAGEGAGVTRVAAVPSATLMAAGLSDGRIWAADLKGTGRNLVKAERGGAISTLAVSGDGRRWPGGTRTALRVCWRSEKITPALQSLETAT